MAKPGGDKKVANSLVAVSCAAVLAVYSAGYARTRAAASQFEAQSAERRPARQAAPQVEERTVASAARPLEATPPEAVAPVRREAVAPSAAETEAARVEESIAALAVVETPEAAAVVASAAPAPVVAPVAAPVAPPPPPTPPPPATPPPPPAPKWKDGTFKGWGTSRHGDIEATVVVANGRIQSSIISQCLTRYSCDVIDMLPPQPVIRQNPDVDYVSRATESANAFYYALVDALDKAK